MVGGTFFLLGLVVILVRRVPLELSVALPLELTEVARAFFFFFFGELVGVVGPDGLGGLGGGVGSAATGGLGAESAFPWSESESEFGSKLGIGSTSAWSALRRW